MKLKETSDQILERVKSVVSKNVCGKLYKDCLEEEKAACVELVAKMYLSECMIQCIPDKNTVMEHCKNVYEDVSYAHVSYTELFHKRLNELINE